MKNSELEYNNYKETINIKKALRYGYKGEGIGIAILDTGISQVADFTSPKNRIIAFKDFINGRKYPYDDNGHGTHVSGIASGNGLLSAGEFEGVAPKSNIISLKILDEKGQGTTSQVIEALRWVIKNKERFNIKIINLSIGNSGDDINFPLLNAVNRCWEAGLIVVSAKGNGKISTGGSYLSKKIISVGILEEMAKEDTLADIYAPGKDIVSCLSPNYVFNLNKRKKDKVVNGKYIKMTGTSMATPIVSGAIALLLEKNYTLTPNDIKSIISKNSKNKTLNFENLL